MITKPKKKETKTYLALIVIGIALVLGCPDNSSDPVSPVKTSIPTKDATDFPANGNIVLTYSGTVVKATGDSVPKITVKEGTAAAVDFDGTVTPEATAGSTPATTTVTLNPTADFAVGKVTITIPAGVFKVGTATGADVAAYSLSFTVVAAAVSPVTNSVPAADATDVAADADIVLTYSGTVVKGTGNITFTPATGQPATLAVTNAAVTLMANAAVPAAGNVAAQDPTTTVTIDPTDSLPEGKVTITIPAGVFKVDTAAGADVAEYTLSFTVVAPSPVTESVPAADATDYPANGNIVLTYSGTVVKGTGNITFTPAATLAVTDAAVTLTVNAAAGGNPTTTTVTIDPAADFALGKVTVAIPAGAFKVDTAAGADVAEYSLSFTAIAADTTGPTLASSVPAEGASGATAFATDADIVLTFDEPVTRVTPVPTDPGTGITYKVSAGQDTGTSIGSASEVTIAGAVVTINPSATLGASQTVGVVTIPQNTFEDAFGNGNVRIIISFSTK